MGEAAAADEEPDTSGGETDEQAADGDQPAVADDEMAALDAVREEVAQEASSPDADDSDAEDSTDADSVEQAENSNESDSNELVDGSDTAGDFYVDTLVSVSNMVIEEHGREDADDIDGGMLRQMGVDDAVDELLAENGGPDMPPEQQVLLGTTVFGLAMLATKTTVLDQALGNADLTL